MSPGFASSILEIIGCLDSRSVFFTVSAIRFFSTSTVRTYLIINMFVCRSISSALTLHLMVAPALNRF